MKYCICYKRCTHKTKYRRIFTLQETYMIQMQTISLHISSFCMCAEITWPIRRWGSTVLFWNHEYRRSRYIKWAIQELKAIQYIPRNMHTVTALLCFVVVIHWLIFPYPSGLLHWHCGNLTIAPVPAKQPWWIWINTSYEFIMNDCITTTKQSTTKPCVYFLGYTVIHLY